MPSIKFFHQKKLPEGWDDFVFNHPKGKIYHLGAWHKLIEKTFGHVTHYFGLRQGSSLLAILPVTLFRSPLFGNFGVSLPYVNYGDCLSTNNISPHLIFLRLKNYLKKYGLDFFEIRASESLETDFPVKTHKVTFYLNLPDTPEELWKTFKAKLRSQIKRPLKEGMFAKKGGIELLNDFYGVFSINMRDLGTPVYTKRFFHKILTSFPQNAFIVVVYNKEVLPVAASFLIKFKKTMEIPWASSVRKYNRFSPNMLLYWESISWAIEQGCSVFDFGRCTPGEGTYRFKKQWGADEYPLFWYYILQNNENLPSINPNNPKFNLAIQTWQRLPVFLTRLIGPQIVKDIP